MYIVIYLDPQGILRYPVQKQNRMELKYYGLVDLLKPQAKGAAPKYCSINGTVEVKEAS